MSRSGLIIFAREPLPGKVKTRLAADIGDSAAAKLYQGMLLDVLDISRKLTNVETVVFWACQEESLPQLAEQYQCRSLRQTDGDLGQRMQDAFRAMFANGYENCCIIGSDTPDLPLAYLTQAFELLAAGQADLVFGPSADGGYYLLGLKQLFPKLFSGIHWSTPLVLRQSLAAADAAGVSVRLLPIWHDIDTRQDLSLFLERSGSSPAAGPKTAILAKAL